MAGDGALFTREDAVEAAWVVVDPGIHAHDLLGLRADNG
jgi:glucose-6-phosphate 1-dehydrogenase